MSNEDKLYCNQVMRSIGQVGRAMMALHGRDLYNKFGLYGQELQRGIRDLIRRSYMGTDLQAWTREDTAILPAFSSKNARRMRSMWDYFGFIYMSHKIQNIRARRMASGAPCKPGILYLRGSDYQFAMSIEGAAVGHTTMADFMFCVSVLDELKNRFDIVKALSPSDLQWAMHDVGPFIAKYGNSFEAIAEFARARDEGLLLNPRNWKERVLDLFPSASLFLVYVSNQSNGLSYELESLAARKLEANTILVLDSNRFGSREPFFALQNRLKEGGRHLYLSVDRDACAVEDPEAFEQLLGRFPHAVALGESKTILLQQIDALIPMAQRHDVAPPAEFPFEFRAVLDDAAADQVAALRCQVSDFIEKSFARGSVANWPVLLLHVEMDIFLNLAFGDILKAAISTARYAAIASLTRILVKEGASERAADLDAMLELCGDLAMDVAYTAFAMGEWNDYGDRRALARERVDAAASDTIALMYRSVERADMVFMQEAKEDDPDPETSDYLDLLKDLLSQAGPPEGMVRED